jgi:pimeloyl-ACP methyl ester carboxylesterase
MSYSHIAHGTKSTTGRSLPRVPALLRAAFGAFGRHWPSLAVRLGAALFLHTRRKAVPEREVEWIAGAEPLEFETVGGRTLRGFSMGSGPTIALVHGWSGRGSQLGAFARPLVERGFRVVGYDGPGHGASPGRQSSLPELAEALSAVARTTGPLHGVVAHSMGTAAATVALYRGASLGRCVFVSPPTDMSYFVGLFCDALGLPREIGERIQRRVEGRFTIRFDDLNGPRIARRLGAAPPLLVIHDRDDREVPFSHGVELSDAWEGAELVTTDGLGHRAILRDAGAVRRAVEFLTAEPDSHAHTETGYRSPVSVST